MVQDIVPGPGSSVPYNLRRVGSTLFFAAADNVAGTELWKTDGTTAGTALVSDIFPGSDGSNPQSLLDVNGTLFFTANDGVNGYELWRSDGTLAGTALVADIAPGAASSNPDGPVLAPGHVFFTADDGSTGRELWAFSVNRAPVPDAGPDQTVEADAPVTLDGSGSADPDGDALTYEWRDADGAVVGREAVVDLGPLPVGSHQFELIVSDGSLSASDTVTVTVLPPPSITVGDASVAEGHSGFTPAVFVVSLSRASARTVTVRYATAPGTARAGSDYSSVSGTASFAPGATTAAVNVPVIGDRRCERDETFLLRLSDPVGGTLADAEGTGIIINDDCGPRSR